MFIEFHGDYCLIKDKVSGQTLLRGTLKDELYQLEGTTVKSMDCTNWKVAIKSMDSTMFNMFDEGISVNVIRLRAVFVCQILIL